MSLMDKQKEVDDWIKDQDVGYWKPFEMLAALVEEVGEISKELNHMHGPKKKKKEEARKELALELGDALFAIVCIANMHKINLDNSFDKMMDKFKSRDKKRWKKR
jgi:NTP pyrophosphatase (non-canonical NTP hydrolase)